MKLRALRNTFLFAFLQKQNQYGWFEEETEWGFNLFAHKNVNKEGYQTFNRTLNQGRWGKVVLIGPKCETVKVGDYVCLEPMMWTNGFNHDGVQIHKSDETKVMLISKEKPNVFYK